MKQRLGASSVSDWRLNHHCKSLDGHQLWFQKRRWLRFDTHKAPFDVDSEASQGEIAYVTKERNVSICAYVSQDEPIMNMLRTY